MWHMAGQIYLIHAESTIRVKIGYSDNPRSRISTLQTGSPYFLRLIKTWMGSFRIEQELHSRFAGNQVLGEWFEWPELTIEQIVQKIDTEIQSLSFYLPDASMRVIQRMPASHDDICRLALELKPISSALRAFKPKNEAQYRLKQAGIEECQNYRVAMLRPNGDMVECKKAINRIMELLDLAGRFQLEVSNDCASQSV